jgi:hypothetical protein
MDKELLYTHVRQEKPLRAFSLAGFKSIVNEQKITFAPLTILAGANSSGKSSIMQPLLLMKQTLEAPYNPGVFLLNGPNVKFTYSKQIISRNIQSNGSFCIKFEGHGQSSATCYRENSEFSFDLEKVIFYGCRRYEIEFEDLNPVESAIEFVCSQDKNIVSKEDVIVKQIYSTADRCLFSLFVNYRIKGNSEFVTKEVSLDNSAVISALTGLIHLPGLRGSPERAYRTSGIGTKFSGTFENYVASLIKLWQQLDPDNLHSLCRHLEHIGLTSRVSATALDATQVEIKVGRLPGATDADLVNIADVGVGVSQTLPVLVALLAAEPGQIVYIEQPEIHLHPLAQYKLAAVIAEASKRGVLVVIETHSDILIRGVQTLVAKGELDPNIVKLHWFSRSPEDGSTTVTCAELDENGSFGDWPQDFDTTTLLTEKAYLDAVEERLFRNAK